ncbi:hypothetical protein VNO78_38028 [Psophocarpus tetragonolobus]|uniref:Secreted protein n=1 Tax=Psophocarpus tetragonolobus TaxID=3891 RepID=A0AAN9NGU3_PSOTE
MLAVMGFAAVPWWFPTGQGLFSSNAWYGAARLIEGAVKSPPCLRPSCLLEVGSLGHPFCFSFEDMHFLAATRTLCEHVVGLCWCFVLAVVG